MSDLIGMLPPGYAPDSCQGTATLVAGALAGLDCHPVPGIVPGGKYEVFPDVATLRRQFDIDFHGTFFKALACPGFPGIGPGTVNGGSGWRGQMACGWMGKFTDPAMGPVGADAFGVMWTKESGSFWGRAYGTNLVDLIGWFNNVVGPS